MLHWVGEIEWPSSCQLRMCSSLADDKQNFSTLYIVTVLSFWHKVVFASFEIIKKNVIINFIIYEYDDL